MTKKLTPEREKLQRTYQSKNSPGSEVVPSEDAPEQEVIPEFEGEPLDTGGEEKIVINSRRIKKKS